MDFLVGNNCNDETISISCSCTGCNGCQGTCTGCEGCQGSK